MNKIEEFFEEIKYSLDFANSEDELRWEDMIDVDKEEIAFVYNSAFKVKGKNDDEKKTKES